MFRYKFAIIMKGMGPRAAGDMIANYFNMLKATDSGHSLAEDFNRVDGFDKKKLNGTKQLDIY